MKRNIFKWFGLLVVLSMLLALAPTAIAAPPHPDDEPAGVQLPADIGERVRPRKVKSIDQPNVKDYLRNQERQRLLEAGLTAEAAALSMEADDRVLVILVEFAGTDVFTWEAGVSEWDPYGIADGSEGVEDDDGNVILGDCSNIITETTTFTYTGPLHNEIQRPLSAEDRSGDVIWTEDFSQGWFEAFMWGDGVSFSYTREDGSVVNEDFTGQSVKDYYLDISGGKYEISGDVIGWVQVPHSTWYYDADECPGARSGGGQRGGMIPGASTARGLTRDALDAVNAISDTIPGFDWANYDQDGDGVIDRLWFVHAGYGEEESTILLNRTSYGEATVWSHSTGGSPYEVAPGIFAGPYIFMPENGGIGVFAHEAGHNLGADDLYTYSQGNTSSGFWTLMADDWTGYPLGYEPPATDPWHLDNWGWLDPFVIDDWSQSYEVTLGQASRFPGGDDVYRALKIPLPDGILNLAVPLWQGENYWWSAKQDLANAMMTTAAPIAIPAEGATLLYDMVYDIEGEWDFLWTQASTDGENWDTLVNDNTQCEHDASWIGTNYDFPDDLCGAGLGGLYGENESWPDPDVQEFDLAAYAGQDVYLRLWFMTDWGTTYTGVFVDNVSVVSNGTTLFADDAESGDDKWVYNDPWQRSNGTMDFTHNYYVQWRNVGDNGGYDAALGDERFRFGPVNTGMLVWYNNNFYLDNEIYGYISDDYSFGPKGRMLVVDAHSEPYRDPNAAPSWLGLEHTNLTSRGQMRDATFTISNTTGFQYDDPYGNAETVWFDGRPAVSNFFDALGYYPGVASEGNGTYWETVAWDASAAIPALDRYTVTGGPDYPGYHIQMVDGRWLGFWEAGQGGSGNPGDQDLQYGVNVCLKEQADDGTWGKIYFSGAKFSPESVVATSTSQPLPGDEVEFVVVPQNQGEGDFFAFVPLNSIPGDIVPGSLTNGAFPVFGNWNSAQVSALYNEGGAEAMQALSADVSLPFAGIAWMGTVPAGTTEAFRFSLWMWPWATGAQFDVNVDFYLCGDLFKTLKSDWVQVQIPAAVETGYAVMVDTYVNAWDADASYGGDSTFSVRQNGVMDALLAFDISDIPQIATVDQATLTLYPTYRTNGSGLNLALYPVAEMWGGNDVTWNTAPAAGDTAAATAVLNAVGAPIEIDVTALVQQWVDGSLMNYGLLLTGEGDTSVEYTFMASDFGGMWPSLNVSYH